MSTRWVAVLSPHLRSPGFPKDGLETEVIASIFRGGFDKLREAGVALLGGHTVQDREIKFGYAITGAVDPNRMLTNAGARVGDRLILTKALGTGVVGTAIKFGRAPQDLVERAIESMRTLNQAASAVLQGIRGVHACTDITGFGLAGHASQMAAASKVTLSIDLSRLPVFEGVLGLVGQNKSSGMTTNREHYDDGIAVREGVSAAVGDLIFDPQTSGGLLVTVDPREAESALRALHDAGVAAAEVGEVIERTEKKLSIW